MPRINRRAFNCVTAKFMIKDLLIRGRVHAVVSPPVPYMALPNGATA